MQIKFCVLIFVVMYYVYILTNPRKTVLYTGVTNNLKRRVLEHREARKTRVGFTGKYFCYLLIYFEEFKYIKDAIAREKEIKKLSRAAKLKLIKTKNPYLHFYHV
jgi:putative endonuclease